MSIEGKVALVTGATRGIGKAIAAELARRGAIVIGTATSAAGAESINSDLAALGNAGAGLVLNVADPDSIAQLFADIAERFEAPAIVVNNAGITKDNIMLRMKDEEWDTVISTNLSSVYRITKQALRAMTKARWGRIINVSSVVGLMGNAGQANYAASKAGMEGFSRALAREVASRGITVNAVAPGFIDTDMTKELGDGHKDNLLTQIPANRLGRAEEVAAVVGFIASEEAGYVTGQTIHVNGGMLM